MNKMMTKLLLVGLGGALGAVCRYLISLLPVRGEFPVLTLLTNLGGALLIGLVVGMSGRLSQNGMLFWKSGVGGGFTTFSTFSLEALRLFEGGKALLGTAYAVSSVLLCLLGVFLGECAGRRIAL